MEKLSGSCLCGGVRYEAEGPLLGVARCHCTQCRKASGAEISDALPQFEKVPR